MGQYHFFFSVEGGRWSESRRVRLEGCKAKVKLRVTEVSSTPRFFSG
jgi:hypothetical protein